MTTVGIIGSGNIGGTVARLATAAGHHVLLSNSRGPATLADLVAELGPLAEAVTADQAQAGEIVVVSIPLKAYPSLSPVGIAGKTVLDTGNYYPDRDGAIADLQARTITESEYLARYLPGAHVVKVFNNIFFKHLLNLARPAGAEDRSYLPVAGGAGKSEVIGFLDTIGYGAVDAGPLEESWRQEPGTPVYGAPYGPFENELGTPAPAEVVRTALAAASR